MPRAAITPLPPRRTQAARRADTRRRLLDAAVGTLVDAGYAATTTTAVCARAGVSQGALFKHFPTKGALVAAAAEHLLADLLASYRTAFARAARRDDRVSAAVAALDGIFASPRLHAAFDLYVAARTDAALRTVLRPVLVQHMTNLEALARDLFPDTPVDAKRFAAIVGLTVNALQGAALGALVTGDRRRNAAMQALLVDLGHQLT